MKAAHQIHVNVQIGVLDLAIAWGERLIQNGIRENGCRAATLEQDVAWLKRIAEEARRPNKLPAEPTNRCQICGEPMPKGEEMFNYHGYSGPCPKPPLAKVNVGDELNGDQIQKWFEEWARLSIFDRSVWQYIADKVAGRYDAVARAAKLEALEKAAVLVETQYFTSLFDKTAVAAAIRKLKEEA